MPREIRKIILNDAEIMEAVMSYRRVTSDLLPPGDILNVRPSEDHSISVEIEMKFGPNVRKDWFVLERDHLTEAMVRYCIENNILVPRQGTRKARPVDKAWVLEIRLRDAEMRNIAARGQLETAARVSSGISV